MTEALIMPSLHQLIWHGGHTLWIDLQATTMHSCRGSIHDFGTQVQKQLMPLQLTGMTIITGCAHLCTSSHGACSMPKTVGLVEPW